MASVSWVDFDDTGNIISVSLSKSWLSTQIGEEELFLYVGKRTMGFEGLWDFYLL